MKPGAFRLVLCGLAGSLAIAAYGEVAFRAGR